MKINSSFILISSLATLLVGCAPSDGSDEFKQATAAYELRDLQRAKRFFEKAAKLNSSNADAHYMLAKVNLDLGNLEEASAAINDARLVASNAADILSLDAQIAYHLKDYAKAIEIFSTLSEDSSLSRRVRSQALVGLGIIYMTENDRDKARVQFLSSLVLERRHNASAYYHLGLLYRDAYDYQEAASEQFEMFVRIPDAPKDKVEKVLHNFLPAINDAIIRAAQEIPNASRRDSQAAAIQIKNAEQAQKKRQYKTALSAYTKAYQLDSLSFPAALGVARMTALDQSRKEQEKALVAYLTAIKLRPKSTSTLLEAAQIAMKLKQYLTAERLYSMAVAANPVKLDAIDGLIRAKERLPGKTKAASLYQKYRNRL
ncbi:MAG: tetratricopeptide repeat protein [Kiritimatiellae bacterium]|nr:tetratricopeptide repeat protein [Kiritimatiellia bacterium]